MKLAIMQPYIFPYIGYFQLADAVDKFIFLDDAFFTKKGWINRNRIIVNKQIYLFSIPLKGISQNKRINELSLDNQNDWRSKLLKTIEQAYRKAPCFDSVFGIVFSVLNGQHTSISDLAVDSVVSTAKYLGIDVEFERSANTFNNSEFKGKARIIDTCLRENARTYVNAAGGRELYSRSDFCENGIDLKFLKTLPYSYRQFGTGFEASLSIIDVLMFNDKDEAKTLLHSYVLEN